MESTCRAGAQRRLTRQERSGRKNDQEPLNAFRRVDIVFVALALLVVGGCSASPRDRNPKVPVNSVHQAVIVETYCLTCHVPTGARPLPAQHPKRQDCLHCHARAQS